MLYGVLPRPDARLLPQVLSPHPAPHPGPRTRPRASAPAPRLALWFSRSGPRIRSSHPVLALLSPHSCLRTPVSALLPPHPGPHSGPVFRAVHSGLALRPRPAPTFCPALWVADLKGGFWKEAFAFRAQAPVPAFWPCVPALCSGPHNPVLAPRLLAFRPASASHFDPRTPARTPVLHSGPVFREGRLLRFEPALRSSRTDPRTPARTPVPCSGRRTPVPCSDPDLPPTFCPTLWAADSGGGSCPRAPSRISFRVPALAPRLLHSRPAFRAAVLKGGFRATFWNVAFRAAVLKGGFRATFWNVAFRAAVSL